MDYLEHRAELNALADKVVYTGSIDGYFDCCFGPLGYRCVRFETEVLDMPNYQGNAVINYTDRRDALYPHYRAQALRTQLAENCGVPGVQFRVEAGGGAVLSRER